VIARVDVGGLLAEQEDRAIESSLVQACREIGFVTVAGHGIERGLFDALMKAGHEFFALPEPARHGVAPKHWNPASENTYRGYFPSTVAGKQGLDIGEPRLDDEALLERPFHERNRLPAQLGSAWLRVVERYFDSLSRVASLLLEALVRGLGGDARLARRGFARPASLSTLRFNFYPERVSPVAVARDDGAGLCCDAHVDSGLLTLLYQDARGGLQVRDARGRWLDIEPDPDVLVVNTGQALELLTGGELVATRHRVLHTKGSRLSVPFFFEPTPDFPMHAASLGLAAEPDPAAPNYEAYLAKSMRRFSEYRRAAEPAA